jgi:hypothetical protein
MKEGVKAEFMRAMASRINIPVIEYFEAKLADVIEELIVAPVGRLERLQGKAQELQELIKLTKSVRE